MLFKWQFQNICAFWAYLLILLSSPCLNGQSVEIVADLRVSGGVNFAGFSTYDSDTFTIQLPGIHIEDGSLPRGTMVSFVSSANNTGATHLTVDNGNELTDAQPVIKRGAIQLQANDIVFGEIILAIFDSASYQLLRGDDIPNYLTECSGQLYNLQTSELHCGTCGNNCPPGHLCIDGDCVLSCQTGLTDCSGTCTDLQNDRLNCGDCGISCNAGEVCLGGVCVLQCQAGLTDCAGICTNLDTDISNCGDCGSPCPAGHICSGGSCVLSCQTGLTNCNGTCTNLDTDELNCGDCGVPCPAGQICVGGNCQTP